MKTIFKAIARVFAAIARDAIAKYAKAIAITVAIAGAVLVQWLSISKIFTGAAIIAANAVTIAMHANAVVIAVNLGVSTSLLGSLIFHISSSERRIRWSKCGENRNHGKFKIYFLNILSDYRFKSCHFHVLHVGLHMKLYFS